MLQYLSLAYCTRLKQLCSTYFNQLESFKSLIYLDLSGCIYVRISIFFLVYINLRIRFLCINNRVLYRYNYK